MGFSTLNLHPLIEKALLTQGYKDPTPIQSEAIPTILAGKDISAAAATGSGKTAAFVLPALDYLQKQITSSPHCKILILTPTRELAMQISDAARKYGKFLRFKIVCLVGGMSYHHQLRDLARGADIIIATPGRLLDHHNSKKVNLSNVSMFILDEADRMVDMGFIEDVNTIEKLTAKDRQTLMFSATLDKRIHQITKKMLKDPIHINLAQQLISSDHIRQIVYKMNHSEKKMGLLKKIITEENIFKGIIFSATKSNADRVAEELTHSGWQSEALHGDLRQGERNRVLRRFRDGEIQFLVATDVASRGIHIDDLTHVINYDIPKSGEDYTHRIGRTGRAGKTGNAYTFVISSEFFLMKRIEKYLGKSLKIDSSQLVYGKDDDQDSKPRRKFNSEKSGGQRKSRFAKDGDRSFSTERKPRFAKDGDRPFSSERKPRFAKDGDQPFSSERKSRFAKDGDRPFSSERKSRFAKDGDRPFSSERKPRFAKDGDQPFSSERKSRFAKDGDRPFSSERKPRFAKDGDRPFSSERKPRFAKDGDRPFSSERKPRFAKDGDQPFSRERKPRFAKDGDRPFSSERKPRFAKDGDQPFSRERKPRFAKDGDRPFSSERKPRFAKDGDQPFSRERKPRFAKDGDQPFSSERKSRFAKDGDRPFSSERKPRFSKDGESSFARKKSPSFKSRSSESSSSFVKDKKVRSLKSRKSKND